MVDLRDDFDLELWRYVEVCRGIYMDCKPCFLSVFDSVRPLRSSIFLLSYVSSFILRLSRVKFFTRVDGEFES